MISTYGYFVIIKILIYLATGYYISGYTPENPKTSKELKTALNLTILIKWTISMINNSLCHFPNK